MPSGCRDSSIVCKAGRGMPLRVPQRHSRSNMMWKASTFFHQRLFRQFQKGDRSASLLPAPRCPQGSSGATSVPAHLAGVPQSKSCAHHLRTDRGIPPVLPPPPMATWPKSPLLPFLLIYRRKTSEITAVLLSDLAAFSYLLGLRHKLNLVFSR